MRVRLLAGLIGLTLLCSCSKSGIPAFRGNYSFKTGGYLDIKGKVYDIERDTVSIDTVITRRTIAGREFIDTTYRYHTVNDTIASRDTQFVRHLAAESGQMRILKSEGSRVKVTMNISGGNPVVYDAIIKGTSISLEPCDRRVSVLPGDNASEQSVAFVMNCKGAGSLYDNTIILDMDYSGRYSYFGLDGNVSASHINCIATRNE